MESRRVVPRPGGGLAQPGGHKDEKQCVPGRSRGHHRRKWSWGRDVSGCTRHSCKPSGEQRAAWKRRGLPRAAWVAGRVGDLGFAVRRDNERRRLRLHFVSVLTEGAEQMPLPLQVPHVPSPGARSTPRPLSQLTTRAETGGCSGPRVTADVGTEGPLRVPGRI